MSDRRGRLIRARPVVIADPFVAAVKRGADLLAKGESISWWAFVTAGARMRADPAWLSPGLAFCAVGHPSPLAPPPSRLQAIAGELDTSHRKEPDDGRLPF